MPTPLGGAEVPLLILLALLLFGSKKLPELARSLGQSLKEFKKSTRELVEEEEPSPAKKKTTELDE